MAALTFLLLRTEWKDSVVPVTLAVLSVSGTIHLAYCEAVAIAVVSSKYTGILQAVLGNFENFQNLKFDLIVFFF